MNQYDMKGRHAVITGGATGLGYAIGQRMLASGARITIWDRDIGGMGTAAEQLKKAHPGAQVACVHVDVAQHDSVVQATAQTVAIAPVDALVNSAGITGPNTKLWDYPVDAWRQVMDINLNGLFYCCRELSAHMRLRNSGRIVNIASVAGKDGNPNASAYSASKQGRSDWFDQVAGQRVGRHRCAHQLHHTRSGAHSDVRPNDARAHRLHAEQNPHGPLWQGRRSRSHGQLAVHRRLFFFHWCCV